MEPAKKHEVVISAVLDMVKERTPLAWKLMTKQVKTLQSEGQLRELGDSAGFMAMDTAMTKNWHQPLQCIGSSKGDGTVFKHKALLVFSHDSYRPVDVFRSLTDADSFPVHSAVDMGILLAQHSASIPDR